MLINRDSKGFTAFRLYENGLARLFLLVVIVLIGIGGLLYYSWQKELIITLTNQEVIPSPTPDPAVNWRLITSDYWGFRVPPGWHYWKCNAGAIWLGPDINEDKVGDCQGEPVTQYMYITRQSKKQLPIVPYTNATPPLTVDRKTITIGGKNAIEQRLIFKNEVVEGPVFYIEHEDSIDTIAYFGQLKREIFDQILSTFKFINQTQEPSCSQTGLCPQPMCIPGDKDCPPPTTCSQGKCLPTSKVTETDSTTACEVSGECWCRNFDGTKFLPGKVTGICNLQTHRCNNCYYE